MALATLAADAGQPLEEALEQADREMTGTLSVIIRAVLDMYGELSKNTIELLKEKLARQRAEEELRWNQEKLLKQEIQARDSRFTTLFEAVPDAVFVLDSGTRRILDVNAVAEQMSGYSRQALVGRNILDLHRDQDLPLHQQKLSKMHKIEHISEVIETVLITAQGREIIVEISVRGPFFWQESRCLVGVFRDVTRERNHQLELERAAYNDPLTGLFNRNGIKRELDGLIRDKAALPLLLVYIDIDRFTMVNEEIGVEAADEAIWAFSERLTTAVPDRALVSRLGGDEFLLVIPSWESEKPVSDWVEYLKRYVARPLVLNKDVIDLTASFGINLCSSWEDASTEILLRQTAHALYEAKLQGRGQYRLFDASYDARMRDRHTLLTDVRRGLENDEFELYFQPKVRMPTGALAGVEALVRWHHPERGLLGPGQFMPVVETHELAIEFGDWVAARALEHLAQWQPRDEGFAMGINLTSRELQSPDLVDHWAGRLKKFPSVAPSWIQIEVLESHTFENLDRTVQSLDRIRSLGISVAIDDFGTGYSSLSYLRRLPIDWLKLDQSFVRELSDKAADRGIVEGVETEEQGVILEQLGCEYAQGYHIARPMPWPELEKWLRSWKAPTAWQSL
ncbi:MAG: putative bifunctional diguanylate cyclase/phosphodiesterase [Pseudomonadota bacterium]